MYPGYWDEYDRDPVHYTPEQSAKMDAAREAKNTRKRFENSVIKLVRDTGIQPSRRLARDYIHANGGYAKVCAQLEGSK